MAGRGIAGLSWHLRNSIVLTYKSTPNGIWQIPAAPSVDESGRLTHVDIGQMRGLGSFLSKPYFVELVIGANVLFRVKQKKMY